MAFPLVSNSSTPPASVPLKVGTETKNVLVYGSQTGCSSPPYWTCVGTGDVALVQADVRRGVDQVPVRRRVGVVRREDEAAVDRGKGHFVHAESAAVGIHGADLGRRGWVADIEGSESAAAVAGVERRDAAARVYDHAVRAGDRGRRELACEAGCATDKRVVRAVDDVDGSVGAVGEVVIAGHRVDVADIEAGQRAALVVGLARPGCRLWSRSCRARPDTHGQPTPQESSRQAKQSYPRERNGIASLRPIFIARRSLETVPVFESSSLFMPVFSHLRQLPAGGMSSCLTAFQRAEMLLPAFDEARSTCTSGSGLPMIAPARSRETSAIGSGRRWTASHQRSSSIVIRLGKERS